MMSFFLEEPRPIDSRGRASPPGEASSGELSGKCSENIYCSRTGTGNITVSSCVIFGAAYKYNTFCRYANLCLLVPSVTR